jgi:hypothetical protein
VSRKQGCQQGVNVMITILGEKNGIFLKKTVL